MKRLEIPSVIPVATLLVFTWSGCQPSTPATSQPGASADTPDAVLAEIVDQELAASPTWATSLGDHRFDGAWPDLSPAGMGADLDRVKRSLERLDALAARELSTDQRVDLAILRDQLELQVLNHEVIRPFQHDPLYYTYVIGAGLDDLMARDFASPGRRGENLAMRMEGLPALVEQGIAHLRQGPVMKPQTEVAIAQLGGVLSLVENEARTSFANAPPAIRQRIEHAIPAAAAAVKEMRRVLEEELLPERATHPWRLGRELFARKLALSLETEIPIDEIVARARASKVRIQADMARQARALHEPLFGQAAPADRPDAEVIRAVLDALAADHATPETLRDAAEENLARLSAFVRSENIIALDESQVLKVIWTPEHQRGVAIAGLDQPGPLERQDAGLPSFYLVQPLPEDWSAEMCVSFLREYNSFMLEVLSIHEAIPGHFVQLYYGRREPSRVRQVYINGTFAEGWAVYSEQVMMERGYAGAGPAPGEKRPAHISEGLWRVENSAELRALAIALHRNKFWLRSTVNAILDHEIHTRGMTEEAALRLLMDEAFQQEGEARKKWTRAQITSTQLSSYFVGASAWLELRDQARKRAGDDYDEAAFHEQALSHGSPPIQHLPALMGW